jgi:hypothetical protein
MKHDPTEERFLADVAEHQMHVLMENGVYRHIRFKRPGTGCYHFDLITYPGHLVYSGDMGCYVFSRVDDMFEFFRTDPRDWNYNRNGGLSINPGYWSEKLQAVDGTRSAASATEFDEDKFKRAVVEHLVMWIRENRDRTKKAERRDLWDSVMSDVIDADGDNGGLRKQIAAHDFSQHVNNRVGYFCFEDFWEHNLTRFTFRFIWCCYALAWGIRHYDASKLKEAA